MIIRVYTKKPLASPVQSNYEGSKTTECEKCRGGRGGRSPLSESQSLFINVIFFARIGLKPSQGQS